MFKMQYQETITRARKSTLYVCVAFAIVTSLPHHYKNYTAISFLILLLLSPHIVPSVILALLSCAFHVL